MSYTLTESHRHATLLLDSHHETLGTNGHEQDSRDHHTVLALAAGLTDTERAQAAAPANEANGAISCASMASSPDPESAERVESKEVIASAGEYDPIREYIDKEGDYVPLRRGTSRWGYNHLVARNRWNSSFDASIRNTLRYGNKVSDGGRAYHYWKVDGVDSNCYPRYMRVAVDFANQNKGIITAYHTLKAG